MVTAAVKEMVTVTAAEAAAVVALAHKPSL